MSPLDERPLLLRALAGERLERPPVWFMRQAGRSLPEYLALRAQAPDFISFCLNPEMAAEATLQPIRRFGFDAAIVFADILLIPGALGQEVRFEKGEGPRLGPLPSVESLGEQLGEVRPQLGALAETLRRVRAELDPSRALIGFAGAPWTVATYMLRGRGGERDEAIAMAYADPAGVDALLDVLVEATIDYLAMQAEAGADALQLFESWAEGLADDLFQRLVIGPHQAIIEGLRAKGVAIPLIGFPRGAGFNLETYAAEVPVQGVGLDTSTPLPVGRRLQAGGKTIQGALDPLLLRAGGSALDARVRQLLEAWGQGAWVFNLGHGVIPDTPVEHIARVLSLVRGEARA